MMQRVSQKYRIERIVSKRKFPGVCLLKSAAGKSAHCGADSFAVIVDPGTIIPGSPQERGCRSITAPYIQNPGAKQEILNCHYMLPVYLAPEHFQSFFTVAYLHL
jgi:hypothetical protein